MAAQLLGMLRQRIVEDLELERHGLKFRYRDPEIFVPFPDGRHVFYYPDSARTIESIARVAPADAAACPASTNTRPGSPASWATSC